MVVPPGLGALRPVVFDDLVRLGNTHDGGYVLPRAILEGSDALVTCGLALEWTFELEYRKLFSQKPIWAFDYTVDPKHYYKRFLTGLKRLPMLRKGAFRDLMRSYARQREFDRLFNGITGIFRPKRIFNRIEQVSYDITLPQVFGAIRGESRLIAKIDIEGSEYRIIDDLLDFKHMVTCILLEFHDTEPFREPFLKALAKLQDAYVLAHLHGNNYVGAASDGLPEVLELTLVRKDLVSNSSAAKLRSHLPLPGLDFPNHPDRPDFHFDFTQMT